MALGLVITELLLGLNDEPSKDFLVYTKSHLLLPDLTRRPTISQGRIPTVTFFFARLKGL